MTEISVGAWLYFPKSYFNLPWPGVIAQIVGVGVDGWKLLFLPTYPGTRRQKYPKSSLVVHLHEGYVVLLETGVL